MTHVASKVIGKHHMDKRCQKVKCTGELERQGSAWTCVRASSQLSCKPLLACATDMQESIYENYMATDHV